MEELHAAATAAAGVAGWRGTVMPLCRVSSFRVFPVVTWLPEGASRLRSGPGPELDGTTLSMWESWPPEDPVRPPSSPLRIEGLILPYRWGTAVGAARRLSGYAKAMILTGINGERRCGTVRRLEADLAGITVMHASADGSASLDVQGSYVRIPRARRSLADRYFEELVFAAAAGKPATLRPPALV